MYEFTNKNTVSGYVLHHIIDKETKTYTVIKLRVKITQYVCFCCISYEKHVTQVWKLFVVITNRNSLSDSCENTIICPVFAAFNPELAII